MNRMNVKIIYQDLMFDLQYVTEGKLNFLW